MPGEAAGFQQIACRVEIHLRAELEVLLGAARDERGEMKYRVNFRCDERARELRVSDIADDRMRERHCALVGGQYVLSPERTPQCGSDVARGTRDEHAHG